MHGFYFQSRTRSHFLSLYFELRLNEFNLLSTCFQLSFGKGSRCTSREPAVWHYPLVIRSSVFRMVCLQHGAASSMAALSCSFVKRPHRGPRGHPLLDVLSGSQQGESAGRGLRPTGAAALSSAGGACRCRYWEDRNRPGPTDSPRLGQIEVGETESGVFWLLRALQSDILVMRLLTSDRRHNLPQDGFFIGRNGENPACPGGDVGELTAGLVAILAMKAVRKCQGLLLSGHRQFRGPPIVLWLLSPPFCSAFPPCQSLSVSEAWD